VSGARADNAAQAHVRGSFVARMDCDDISLPERFAAQLRAMQRDHLDICGSQGRFCGGRDEPVWFPERHEAIVHELVFRAAMMHSSEFVRAEVRRAAPLDETTFADDYEWQTRMILKHRFGNASEELVHYRIHPDQWSRRPRTDADWTRARFRYFFALFPDARLDDFQALHHVIRKTPIGSEAMLDRAGQWLARLSSPPCTQLRRRMAERWAASCEGAAIPQAKMAAIRDRYGEQIAAAVS
jgi:glycosyltransferase involved in cell wall biosynthesis